MGGVLAPIMILNEKGTGALIPSLNVIDTAWIPESETPGLIV